jgi:SAM-dependent methyltransferase
MFSKYQNIEIAGEPIICDNVNRKDSKFWNEGKWDNFIKPLLPKDPTDMTFVEIGCNAGLFVKLAKEYGFKNAYGYEKDKTAYERGIRFRDSLKLDYKIENKCVGVDFNIDDMPMADVVLLSNVHYYFNIQDWLRLVDRLREKAVHIIVISRPVDPAYTWWKPLAGIGDVRLYFRDWNEVKTVYNIRTKDDPSPRVMWSFCFKNRLLERTSFKSFRRTNPGGMVKIPKQEFTKSLVERDDVVAEKTSYYEALLKRMSHQWSQGRTLQFVKDKIKVLYDIKKNGIKEPVICQLDYKMIDGGHRVELLKALGYQSVIIRKV